MRSAGSPCRSPGRWLLSIAISGVKGASERPGLENASRTHVRTSIGRDIRPRCSSIPSSQTEITETRSRPPDSARRMADNAPRESWLTSPRCAHNQQRVSRSRRSSFIRFPFHVNRRNDVADNLHGSFHAANKPRGTIDNRNELGHGPASLGNHNLLPLPLHLIQHRETLCLKLASCDLCAHDYGHCNMVTC